MDRLYIGRVTSVIQLLEGKWTIAIICAMRLHPVRLSDLKREIPLASKKALIATLRSLEAATVVVRKDLSSSVLHVEYEIAESMRAPLIELLSHLAEWSELHSGEIGPMSAPDAAVHHK